MNDKKKKVLIIAIAVICIIVASIVFTDGKGNQTDNEPKLGKNMITSEIMFPHQIEKNVSVESLFQFSGTNPDTGNEGENIAALFVTNNGDEHIEKADIIVKIKDSEELHFYISDLPAGKSINVFETDDKQFNFSDQVVSIKGDVHFGKQDKDLEENVKIVVEETEITISNVSNKNIKDMIVHCHCALDDVYFGGLTYNYPIRELKAGESVQLDAIECYMGEASVVRLSLDDVDN